MDTEENIFRKTDDMQRYATVKQFASEQSVFSESSLRWMIYNKETNGFAPAFKRVGPKRILIDVPVFYELIGKGVAA